MKAVRAWMAEYTMGGGIEQLEERIVLDVSYFYVNTQVPRHSGGGWVVSKVTP